MVKYQRYETSLKYGIFNELKIFKDKNSEVNDLNQKIYKYAN